MDTALAAVASRLRQERGWELCDDVTDDCPTDGAPVQRVLTEHGEASLRVGLRPEQVEAYRVMQHSGVTPSVHEHGGADDPVPWVLLEWVQGTPLATLGTDLAPDTVLDWTQEVFAATQRMYGVQAAPREEHQRALGQAYQDEWVAVRELDLNRSTPPIISILQSAWEPGVLLHGHLWPTSVLRENSGGLRLVDLDGASVRPSGTRADGPVRSVPLCSGARAAWRTCRASPRACWAASPARRRSCTRPGCGPGRQWRWWSTPWTCVRAARTWPRPDPWSPWVATCTPYVR